jgi:SRSO17 transposase
MDAGLAQVQGWTQELETLCERIAPRFGRVEVRRRAGAFLRGLLAGVERKNGWQLAEQAGEATPDGMQRLLNHARWDPDEVRDDLRGYVVEHLGDPGAVLVIDETGFLKKGTKSAGVQRQYSGTAGRIENCQVGVFLAYASRAGHALVDRELYLPERWTADRQRRQAAGIGEQVEFHTKPQLARVMLERTLDAQIPVGWVTGDEVYGSDGKLRRALEARGQAYVLAVRSNECTTTWPPYGPPGQVRMAAVAATVPAEAWQRLSCGEGAQGPRLYDWAAVPLRPALRDGWVHALLVRRHPEHPDELAYYLVYAPTGTPLAEIVRVAGARWTIDDLVKLAKGQVGLDHYEVRSWQGWYRHITLALLALAALTIGAREKGDRPAPATSRSPSRRSADCSSDSSGPPPARRTRSSPGPAGVVSTRRSPKRVTAVAA